MSHRQLWMCKTDQTKIGTSQEILRKFLGNSKVFGKFLKLGNMLIFPGNFRMTIFYTCVKATDSTDYLTDAHYRGVHYIRSLMQSRVTTKYEIRGILKIEKAIDAMG